MEYTHLTGRDLVHLRRERILALEADHARACLVLEENPTDRRACEDVAELERRIEHHRGQLPPPPEEVTPDVSDGNGEPHPRDEAERKAVMT